MKYYGHITQRNLMTEENLGILSNGLIDSRSALVFWREKGPAKHFNLNQDKDLLRTYSYSAFANVSSSETHQRKQSICFRSMCIFLLFISNIAYSQPNLDSLYGVWSSASLSDTSRFNAISKIIAEFHLNTNPDSAYYYAEMQNSLAQKTGNRSWQANALHLQAKALQKKGSLSEALKLNNEALGIYRSLADSANIADVVNFNGTIYLYMGKYNESISSFSEAVELYTHLGDKGGIGNCLTSIGSSYVQQGNYAQALHYLNQGRRLAKELNNEQLLMTALNSIGLSYLNQNESELALKCFMEVLETSKKLGDQRGIAGSSSNLGSVYEQLKDYENALKYYLMSLEIAESKGMVRGIITLKSNLGSVYRHLGKLDEALRYIKQSIELSEKLGFQTRVPPLLILSNIYIEKNQLDSALIYAKQGFKNALELNELLAIYESALLLSEIHNKMGNYKQSLEIYKQAIVARDSLKNEENQKAVIQQQFVFDYEKKSLADSLKREEEKLQLAIVHQREVHQKNQTRNLLAAGMILLLVIAGGLYGRMGYMRRTKNIIEKEKDRSDQLLLNILPEEIADELKISGKADARNFEAATVLFTDFKGFTELSAQLEANDLVEEINSCFEAFDHIVAKYDIEKIKTIGDAYMVTGGLPKPSEDAAKRTVLAALEMQQFIIDRYHNRQAAGQHAFQMRVGIHTGPVVAGIVGVRKFQYDVWGDTVNTASRMESSGEVNLVNISQATYDLIKDDKQFTFDHRGKVDAKGKGEVDMYFVSLA
jgi:class 3 adenylate cyclase